MTPEIKERNERAFAYIRKKTGEKLAAEKQKNKDLNIATTIAVACAVIIIVTLATVVAPTPQPYQWKPCDYEEFQIMQKKYKLHGGNEIYNFPEKPYIMWQGKMVYLKTTGVCKGGKP